MSRADVMTARDVHDVMSERSGISSDVIFIGLQVLWLLQCLFLVLEVIGYS